MVLFPNSELRGAKLPGSNAVFVICGSYACALPTKDRTVVTKGDIRGSGRNSVTYTSQLSYGHQVCEVVKKDITGVTWDKRGIIVYAITNASHSTVVITPMSL